MDVSTVLKPPAEDDRFKRSEGVNGNRDTCFGMYLGHPQACQYRNFIQKKMQQESKEQYIVCYNTCLNCTGGSSLLESRVD